MAPPESFGKAVQKVQRGRTRPTLGPKAFAGASGKREGENSGFFLYGHVQKKTPETKKNNAVWVLGDNKYGPQKCKKHGLA